MQSSPILSSHIKRGWLTAGILATALVMIFGGSTPVASSAIASPAATSNATLGSTAAQKTLAVSSTSLTPTIDSAKLLSNAKADVVFPSLIRLLIDVQAPTDQVKSAQITLTQGSFTDKVDVTLATGKSIFVLINQASRIDIQYPLADHAALKLFQDVNYDWQITLKSGPAVSKSGKFSYLDTAHQLQAYTVGKLTIYAPPVLGFGTILPSVQLADQQIVRDTGVDPSQTVALYPIGLHFCTPDAANAGQFTIIDTADGHVFPCDPAQVAKLYANSEVGYFSVNNFSPFTVRDDLVTQLATNAYDTLWGLTPVTGSATSTPRPNSGTAQPTDAPASTQRPPDWFRSGLAALYASNNRTDSLTLVRQAAASDTLFTLNDLANKPTFSGNNAAADALLWNAQSYFFTLYLTAKYGADAPFKLAKQLAGQPGDFQAALGTITNGVTLADLNADWQNWIVSPQADSALGFSPYPTAPTPTNIIPTAAPSFTPRPTATASPSTPRNTPTFGLPVQSN